MKTFRWPLFIFLMSAILDVPRADTRDPKDCDDFYYGIDGPVDHASAWSCYAATKNYPMLIVMRLNGEGVSKDVIAADSLYRAWVQTEEGRPMATNKVARALIEEYKGGRVDPGDIHVTYCEDLGSTDSMQHYCDVGSCAMLMSTENEMTRCGYVRLRIEKSRAKAEVAKGRALLPESEKSVLDSLVASSETYLEAEFQRVNAEYVLCQSNDGEIFAQREIASQRDEFMKLLSQIVERHPLKTVDSSRYKAADVVLNKAYHKKLLAGERYYGDNKLPVGDFKQYLKNAQLAWIHYRDLWTDFASVHYGGKMGKGPVFAVQSQLSFQRASQLESSHKEGDPSCF